MWKAKLNESQAEIKIVRRNINNLMYAHDTTLMAESEEELKSLLVRVKEKSFEKTCLKLNINLKSIEGGKLEAVTDFIFLGSTITVDSDYTHEM